MYSNQLICVEFLALQCAYLIVAVRWLSFMRQQRFFNSPTDYVFKNTRLFDTDKTLK